jgi:Type ISP C-terminal specificity domain/N-6 DNA Methylase
MHPLETYIRELGEIRSSGEAVPETSYYGALATLFNEVGKSLKPRVRCIINLRNRGAGIPDGGLFTPDQFQRSSRTEPIAGQPPARGVIEIKPTKGDAWITADSKQVSRYWDRYGQVLVTNYRDFVLVGRDAEGHPTKLETYRLAENAAGFWEAAQHPRQFSEVHGERFTEYLKRVMLHAAPLASPADVAWFLASYARDAKARIEHAELPALATVRAALEEALGLKFEGEKGEHFFRSTLVQTLFYGVFSAWVLWSKEHPPSDRAARFDWRQAIWHLRVPMIAALFEQVATPTKLEHLGLVEVLDWTATALNRVSRGEFFARFEEEHAVQYFYEPFLEAFDPTLRKELGVWYTPTEIVQYMVARVDTVLREELGLADGLADPRVYVLDPCCGTGAFLVEVLKRIAATLKQKGDDALVSNDIKRAAMERVFGFEILPAPFVVAHLQLGLLLRNLGAPLTDDRTERAGVYLTNALTGWELRDQPPLSWPEMEAERTASSEVKRGKPILVILGNPPYNAFAGVSPEEEEGLVEVYKGVYFIDRPRKSKSQRVPLATKKGAVIKKIKRYRLSDPEALGGWGIKKFNLDDLYIRFFRLAERRIAEVTGKGVVCYISNFSYLSDPSFVIMRERFLSEFDAVWFDSLNGDSRETGKLTPDGKPDPSVFSTGYNREGIRLGTAIGLMVRRAERDERPLVRSREFWGVNKRRSLVDSLLAEDLNLNYQIGAPSKSNRLSFRTSTVTIAYLTWPKLVDLCGEKPISGLQEMRKGKLMAIDRDSLEKRMRTYYDPTIDWATIKAQGAGPTADGGRFIAENARRKAQGAEAFQRDALKRYALYPFDVRWCYHTTVRPLWNEPRPSLALQQWEGNRFIVTRMMAERPNENIAITVTAALPDYHLLRPNAIAIPIRLRRPPAAAAKRHKMQNHLFDGEVGDSGQVAANLSPSARAYLALVGITDPDAAAETASSIWMHALAIGYSPSYLSENADGIRQDWPRVPLPNTKMALETSAALGRQVAALLDTENAVKGVTAGTFRQELKTIAVVSRVGGGTLNPDSEDLALNAGWGHGGKGGITMPGKGKVSERAYTPAELEAIAAGVQALGLSTEQALAHLGETTFDIYLNDVGCWRNVPGKVWDYTIGGYQVIKKWLSYRERTLLGRALTSEEAREVMNIAHRIAAILLLEPALDANYEAVKQSPYGWPAS